MTRWRNSRGLVVAAALAVVLATRVMVLAVAEVGDEPEQPLRPAVASKPLDLVTISWDKPRDGTITGYQILRRNRATDQTGMFHVIEDDTGSADTTYADATVQPASSYVYRVKARNAFGLDRVGATLAPVASASDDLAIAGGGAFSDDDGSVHEPALDALAARGYLDGTECGDGQICPGRALKRWEMAVWLGRVLSDGELAPMTAPRFADVDADEWWAPHVERFADLGVTAGCRTDPPRYCPDRNVTRAQMATFFKRAFQLGDAPPRGFVDTAGNSHEANIDALAAASVTAGCRTDPLRYCPADSVTRAQMATFLARALGLVPAPSSETRSDESGPTGVPGLSDAAEGIAGDDTQIAEVYGRLLADLMDRWGIPGGAFAFARDGRLLFAGGYGTANLETRQPVRPDSLFRIASVSKPITGVALLKLVEEGQLNLDDHAFDLLAPDAFVTDPRLRDITVRQLLHHSAGWDAASSFDPMFNPHLVASYLGIPTPVSCAQTVRFMLTQSLDYDPGERHAYSNFGYCALGRIIEAVTGVSYEEFVSDQVLEPLGITRMQIGATLASAAAEGEVRYVGYPGELPAHSVLSDDPETVPSPYGGFHLRAMEAHGGWVASAIDIVRFAVAVDGSRPPAVLSPTTVETMLSSPDLRSGSDQAHHYGMGWLVRPVGDEATWWHDGSLPGTSSLLVRTYEGMVWSVVFNSRPEQWVTFMSELDALMWQGLGEIDDWPSHDLFAHYGYE